MLLLWRNLCRGKRVQCETTDQLIIVFCRSRIFELWIWPHDVVVQYAMQCIVSCWPFHRHQGFKYTLMKCPTIIRNEPVHGSRKPVSNSDVSLHLGLDCNHHIQCFLTILCVLVYILFNTGLTFLGLAVAHWKWFCKAFIPAESRFHSKPASFPFWVYWRYLYNTIQYNTIMKTSMALVTSSWPSSKALTAKNQEIENTCPGKSHIRQQQIGKSTK